MRKEYSVIWNDRQVGVASVQQEGLYCQIQCKFVAPIGHVYLLYAQAENKSVRLGVPILCGEEFILNTKIPVKRFPQNIQGIKLTNKQYEDIPTDNLLIEGSAVSNLRYLMEKKLNFTEGGVFLIDTCINRHK